MPKRHHRGTYRDFKNAKGIESKFWSLSGRASLYDIWQVSDNGGLAAPNVAANALAYYSGPAVGFQSNFLLPHKDLLFFFKYYEEYRAIARPGGRTVVFGGSYTFRIPKPQPPKH
jgi:hypothetical protein